MMGAKNFGWSQEGLTFKISGSPDVSHIRILLTPLDLYDVTFLKVRGMKVKTFAEEKGVDAEQLHSVIEKNTGLYLSL